MAENPFLALMERQQQALRKQVSCLQEAYEKAQGGGYSMDEWVRDATKLWSGWWEMTSDLMPWLRWGSVSPDQTPTLVFAVDDAASSTDPKDVYLSRAPESLGKAMWRVGADQNPGQMRAMAEQFLSVQLLGQKLEVALMGLREGDRPQLPAGQYAALIFEDEEHAKHPLAHVRLLRL